MSRPLRLSRSVAVLALVALLAACAHAPPRNPLATWVPSPNHDIRRPVLIVVHFTNQHSAQESLDTLRTKNSGGPVSSHYLVGSDGHIYQLVSDQLRAWHGGGGHWGTITDITSASIGIELDND
ncbi:MAG TPA: N-acetylmuramoyl-L-alanine amidase, partial [Rhodanobacter sp.]|nr:N-acetylmuramoyl-L-alanine amidase [Rhodanobacter sp.]